ncbi:hypothetical protein [Mycobacterium sp. Root135]|uniref:hypothetical protein n=1 Tax=Mycobacterium sp. Root135 TaxID=1736457 RepID=UPI000AEBCADA|nr:hypothetical protein [Mycobacterium sp. Root135]
MSSLYGGLHSGFRRLPPSWRTALKRALKSEGHRSSTFDGITARKDALGKKRLDRALDDILGTLGLDLAKAVAGKTCIDFGAGYVPTDGLALWLMGASEVYGVDYNHIAKPREIARAVRAADASRIARQLKTLEIDSTNRLTQLTDWAQGGNNGFPPGYRYIAPADVIASPSLVPKFDLLVSTSVLEHIQPSLMIALLDALKSRENGQAAQIHKVDLRDHRDFEKNPYGFLDPSDKFDAEVDADSRGNGMTIHDWEALLSSHPRWNLGVGLYETGRAHLVPAAAPDAQKRVVADAVVLRSVEVGSSPPSLET